MLLKQPVITISGLTGTGKTALANNLSTRFDNASILHTGNICRLMVLYFLQMDKLNPPFDAALAKVILYSRQFSDDLLNPGVIASISGEFFATHSAQIMGNYQIRHIWGNFVRDFAMTHRPGKNLVIMDTHREVENYQDFVWLPICLTARADIRYWRKHPARPAELAARDTIDDSRNWKNPRAYKIDTSQMTAKQVADMAERAIRKTIAPYTAMR
jgi:cytidylate kinase